MKKRIKNWLLSHLFNTVVDTDVFVRSGNGQCCVDGQVLTETEILDLGRQVRDFKESRLYSVLYGTVSDKAKKMLFVRSTNYEDIVAGKTLLLALDLHEQIMKGITEEYKKKISA